MPQSEFEVFFDGDCPLCAREIRLLRRLDGRGRIRFINIAAEGFDASDLGIPPRALMATIHGRLPSGEVVTGVEVFRRLYSTVGLGWLVTMTRVPGIRHILDIAYAWFARNRLRLTGRCDSAVCSPRSSGLSRFV